MFLQSYVFAHIVGVCIHIVHGFGYSHRYHVISIFTYFIFFALELLLFALVVFIHIFVV